MMSMDPPPLPPPSTSSAPAARRCASRICPSPEEVFKVSRLGVAKDHPVRHRPEPDRARHLDRQRRVAARPAGRRRSSASSASAGSSPSPPLLQTFYNVECSRYVMATGEVPIVGWGRVPPGWLLWVPVLGVPRHLRVHRRRLGGRRPGRACTRWSHGDGRPRRTRSSTRLLRDRRCCVVVFLITAAARKISRALELANWVMVGAILLALLIVVPVRRAVRASGGRASAGSSPRPRRPTGSRATQLGGLAGFTALASGLNWYVMGHYRDKGYGMGSPRRVTSPACAASKQELEPVGVTFPDDPENAGLWRRWYRLLLIDMWGVFFVGAMLGMLLPTILMAHAVELSGETADRRPTCRRSSPSALGARVRPGHVLPACCSWACWSCSPRSSASSRRWSG